MAVLPPDQRAALINLALNQESKEDPNVETVIKHAGISALSMLGAAAIAAGSFINPIATGMIVAGFIWWRNNETQD